MNLKGISSALLAVFLIMSAGLHAYAQQTYAPSRWGDWRLYGEQQDGTYMNPVLPADFSDIDCTQHDGYYYAISSTFQFEPGMVILRSTDMVNWSIYSHAVADVTQIGPALNYDVMDRYARGVWAGAVRYHKGLFYLYFGCPDEGMFMTTAKSMKGPWSPLAKMNIDGGWDDCCPLFDDDGKNYFVATHYADGYRTYIFRLSDDGKTVDWNSKVLVNEGYGREANKLYKFNGRYYHLFSQDRDGGRYLMMQRADSPMGPYTESHQLSYAQRQWNEPNQGGYLQDKEGNWFFLTHHGHGDWGGREASLLPVTWTADGWPVIGEPDKNNIGQMVWRHSMPVAIRKSHNSKSANPMSDFNSEEWEWNCHPRPGFYRRTRHSLVLKAFRPLEKDNLLKAGNTLTLRSYRTENNSYAVCIDLRNMAEGQRSGICHFSASWSEFGVKMQDGRRILYHRTNRNDEKILAENFPVRLYLRSTWGLDAICHYSYSLDGREWTDCGAFYRLEWGNYRGDRFGLFTYNNDSESGEITFTSVRTKGSAPF